MKAALLFLPAVATAAVLAPEARAGKGCHWWNSGSCKKLDFKVFANELCTPNHDISLEKFKVKPGHCKTFPQHLNGFIFDMPTPAHKPGNELIESTYAKCDILLYGDVKCRGKVMTMVTQDVQATCVNVNGFRSVMAKCVRWARDESETGDGESMGAVEGRDDIIVTDDHEREFEYEHESDETVIVIDDRDTAEHEHEQHQRCDECGCRSLDHEGHDNEERCDKHKHE